MSKTDETDEKRRALPKPVVLTPEEVKHIAAGTAAILPREKDPGTLSGAVAPRMPWPPAVLSS